MEIQIISVGKLKEKYLKAGIGEYKKRLGAYTNIKVVEVADEHAPENLSQAEMNEIKKIEGQRILQKINDQAYVFALDLGGKTIRSEDLAKQIETNMIQGKSKMAFIIGGSLGLDDAVLKRSNAQISFGQVTYPHQLMRLILIEQIYRSFKIIKGEPYHK